MGYGIRNRGMLVLTLAMAVLLQGCLPKEEVLPDAPVIKTTAIKEYKKAEVMRGDIIESVTIDCTYTALYKEDLKFSIGGVAIDHIYVKEGDRVNKGDILADLVMDDTQSKIEEYTDNLELLNLNLQNLRELKELAVSSLKKLSAIEGYTKSIGEQYARDIAGYDNDMEKLTDSIYIVQKRLDTAKKDLSNHRILAGMDGMVSFVSGYKSRELSNKETTLITLYNPDEMLFLAEGDNVDYLTPGKKVTVKMYLENVEAKVLTPDGKEKYAGRKEYYLKAIKEPGRLQMEERGEITLILKEAKDVLFLPTVAVHEENGAFVVYVEDADGFKSVKEIKTGFTAERKIQILSGLEEGDSVILE